MVNRKRLLKIACAIHAGVMIICVFPDTWFPRRWLEKPVLLAYQSVTVRQDWKMFTSHPWVQSMSITVRIPGQEDAGPLTPGLRPWATGGPIRYYYAFQRMFFATDPLLKEAWLEKIGNEAAGRGGKSFELVVERHYIRHLFHSSKDGKTTKQVVETLGPFPAASR